MAGGVLQTDFRVECAALKEKDAKVFPLYTSRWAKDSFDEIAKLTGGESRELDLGDAEALIHAVCETALEDIGGAAMQEQYKKQYR